MLRLYGWFSIASRLEPLWGGSLLYNTKFQEISGTHFINLDLRRPWIHPMVLNTGLLDWESSTLTTRPLRLTPSFPKMLHRKKENNTVCSSINWSSNLVNNVLVSNCSLPRFQHKVTVLLHLKLKEFPWLCAKK